MNDAMFAAMLGGWEVLIILLVAVLGSPIAIALLVIWLVRRSNAKNPVNPPVQPQEQPKLKRGRLLNPRRSWLLLALISGITALGFLVHHYQQDQADILSEEVLFEALQADQVVEATVSYGPGSFRVTGKYRKPNESGIPVETKFVTDKLSPTEKKKEALFFLVHRVEERSPHVSDSAFWVFLPYAVILLVLLSVIVGIVGIVWFIRSLVRRGRITTHVPLPIQEQEPPKPAPYTCPRCGTALQADSPQGLCPRCVMGVGLATQTEATGEFGPHGTKVTKPPPSPADIAKNFPQLEILDCLGRGGMGVVYKARQPKLNRLVALKILAPEKGADPKFAERFLREAQALARLSHPNIVTVHDFGEADGMFYLLMEYVDGATLRQLLGEGRMKPETALTIVPKICDALQFAHEQGVVHRDIKPENVLLDKQGRVKIADFGIAKIVGEAGRAGSPLPAEATQPEGGAHGVTRPTIHFTQDQVLGTPHYMAPEQVDHPQTVDHRADIYSLGVVFYEMLTGELPLGKFQPPSKKVQVDVRLDEVVLHALEKEPERRYQRVSEVKSAVETIATTPPGSSRREEAQTRKSESGGQKAEKGQYNPWELVSIIGSAAFLVFLLFFATPQLHQPINGIFVAVCIVGLGISAVHWLGLWPFPSPLFPERNFSCRNLRRNRGINFSQAPEPHFSRTAVVGAVWAVLGTFIVIGTGLLAQTYPDAPPRGLFRGFMMVAMVAGLAAPIGTTILGWIAVSQIRRSAGKLYGVRLAMFDALLFPLLVLAAVLLFVWYGLLDWGGPVLRMLQIRQPSLAFSLIVWLPWLAVSVSLCVWTARRVARTIGRTAAMDTQPPASASERFLWKFAAATVLVLLGLGTWIYWAQRPRELGLNLVSESPDGRYSAMAQTFHAMRVFGGDKTYYRFTVQGEGGTLFQQWKVPVTTAKLATNSVALSLDEVVFNSTNRSSSGSIQWSEDSQRVTFSIRGIEVFGYNVKTRSTSSQEGYLPERQVTLTADDDLQNCYLDLDTGRVLTPPSELVASLRVNGHVSVHAASGNSAMRAWLRSNGVDIVRREREKGLFQMDGASNLIADKGGALADLRAFDTLSTEFVVQWAEYFEQLRTNLYYGEQFKSGEPLPYYIHPGGVYTVKTRGGGIALVEILKDNPRSGRTELRYKLVQSSPSATQSPVNP